MCKTKPTGEMFSKSYSYLSFTNTYVLSLQKLRARLLILFNSGLFRWLKKKGNLTSFLCISSLPEGPSYIYKIYIVYILCIYIIYILLSSSFGSSVFQLSWPLLNKMFFYTNSLTVVIFSPSLTTGSSCWSSPRGIYSELKFYIHLCVMLFFKVLFVYSFCK